ncbi:Membrane associated eicosanoid/glutathione metabolism-like domain protein [Nannochloropsis gaditana]|uniref:Membrane associated eicosanoid/glutathione metabolism-like domain protein n=1 Tax=Nannochloropsis gaditana TaxID=72520 RepID=W7TYQ9_9STRA|nr:Membrane associated eicosanoid/glutathione metabolism-like domain protein [Nannochloropsis gaditana]
MFGFKNKAAKEAAVVVSSPSVWGHCDNLAPPLVATPLRAILWCLALTFLPHILRIPMVLKLKGWYNHLMPRTHQFNERDTQQNPELVRMIQRTTAAHANSWEAFTYFSVACIVAHVLKLKEEIASRLCTLFLGLRFCYILLYIGGTQAWVGTLRSLVWFAAFVAAWRLILLSLSQAGL